MNRHNLGPYFQADGTILLYRSTALVAPYPHEANGDS